MMHLGNGDMENVVPWDIWFFECPNKYAYEYTCPAVNPALQPGPQVYNYPASYPWLWLHTIRSHCIQ